MLVFSVSLFLFADLLLCGYDTISTSTMSSLLSSPFFEPLKAIHIVMNSHGSTIGAPFIEFLLTLFAYHSFHSAFQIFYPTASKNIAINGINENE